MGGSRRRVFISYRRADSVGHAGRLEADLTRRLGDRVFMDVSDIAPGAEFPKALDAELRSCGAVLAVIGPRWRRAFDERPADEDYVRLELRQGLAHDGVSVVPVLVQGASPPSRDDLPDDLQPLADRQAVALRDDRWDDDVAHLATQLRTTLGIRRIPVRLIAVAATVLVAGGGYWALGRAPRPAPYDRQRAHDLAIAATRKAAASCHGRAGAAGTCPLAFRFGPDGAASNVWYDAGWCDFKGTAFGSCVLDHLEQVRIPPFNDMDAVEIGLEMRLNPGESRVTVE